VPLRAVGGDDLVFEWGGTVPRRTRVSGELVRAFEEGDYSRLEREKLTPEQLRDIKRRAEENGLLGEEFVLNHERKVLREAGKRMLAEKVRWISQSSAAAGYDILSYEMSGAQKCIEVKSTSGTGRTFEITYNEWAAAQSAGASYCIYRVINVLSRPDIIEYRDPCALEAQGKLQRVPSTWLVTEVP
jgi:hypothetical protein